MDRSFTIVVNPAAGRGRTIARLPEIVAALDAAGLDCEVRISMNPGDPDAIARDATGRGRIVVACGGDGLVGHLAGTLADADGTLGIIPTGSGNDFARALGYDHRDPVAAVATLASGQERRVDLGKVGHRWFACVASTGFDAEANRWANTVRRLTGTSLYVAATLRTLATYHPRRIVITVDGTAHVRDAWLVAVGNAASYGGGMKVAPAASVTDGTLDATLVGPVSRGGFLRTFPKVFRGRHVDHPLVETFTGTVITIEAPDDPALEVYADGEPAGLLPAEITIHPDALNVILP